MWRVSSSITLILVLGFIAVPPVQSVEYYFDSETGSDENQGVSAGQPFRSLAKLSELELKPGDVVHFRRGSVWRGQIDFQGNGVEGSPIHLDAYGEGHKPEFLASVRPAEWVRYGGEVYHLNVPTDWLVGDPEVNGVFHYPQDGVPVRLRRSREIPSERGRYHYDAENRNLYVVTSDGKSPADHPVEVSVITPLLDLADRYNHCGGRFIVIMVLAIIWIVSTAEAQHAVIIQEENMDENAYTKPQFGWQTAAPESQGMSSQKLDALRKDLEARNTKALLVIRNDKIVYEWYAPDHSATKRHYTASLAKALVGGVCLAVAINDGLIAMDDPVAKYVPQWRDQPEKSKITIRQLGSHTSGLDEPKPKDQGSWRQAFWERQQPPNDPFSIARDKANVLFEPGTQFHYSNAGIAMLSYAITMVLKDAQEKDLRVLLRERIMRPIGVPDEAWSVGYGQTFTVEGLPLVAPWGGGGYTARAVARVGRLMLRKGNWEGVQLISGKAVQLTTNSAGLPGSCGMGWWTNADGRFVKLPTDAFWGSGAQHQTLLVIPSLNLICVRNGGSLYSGKTESIRAQNTFLFEPLMNAITDAASENRESKAPYPQSHVPMMAEAPASGLSALAVSPNGHFLTREDGAPFFWLGDTAWCLFTRSPEEVRLYMENRSAKGFNVIQAMAIRTGLTTQELRKNYRGDSPFDSLDPVRLNERYWQHLDFIVDEAARNGLYLVLFGMWGRNVSRLFPDPTRNNHDYGHTLALRYRDRPHILWAVCGEYEKIREDWETDSQITDVQRDQIRYLARGLDAGRARHNLMTIHPVFTSSRDFHNDSWLDFNMQQTWGHIAPNIRRIGEDFRRLPTKPVLNGEPGYENRPQGDCPAWHLRLEGYCSVFSGAFGFTYGAHKVWRFEPEWEEALDYPGAGQMRHLRALMESRPCLDRIPDPDILTSDPGSMSKENPTYCVATRAADGSFLFVYTPQGRGFEVNMTKLSGTQAHAWWYNPRDGLCYDAEERPTEHPFGMYPTQGTRRFSPPGPSGEGRDWVLVLEDAVRGAVSPGTQNGSPDRNSQTGGSNHE